MSPAVAERVANNSGAIKASPRRLEPEDFRPIGTPRRSQLEGVTRDMELLAKTSPEALLNWTKEARSISGFLVTKLMWLHDNRLPPHEKLKIHQGIPTLLSLIDSRGIGFSDKQKLLELVFPEVNLKQSFQSAINYRNDVERRIDALAAVASWHLETRAAREQKIAELSQVLERGWLPQGESGVAPPVERRDSMKPAKLVCTLADRKAEPGIRGPSKVTTFKLEHDEGAIVQLEAIKVEWNLGAPAHSIGECGGSVSLRKGAVPMLDEVVRRHGSYLGDVFFVTAEFGGREKSYCVRMAASQDPRIGVEICVGDSNFMELLPTLAKGSTLAIKSVHCFSSWASAAGPKDSHFGRHSATVEYGWVPQFANSSSIQTGRGFQHPVELRFARSATIEQGEERSDELSATALRQRDALRAQLESDKQAISRGILPGALVEITFVSGGQEYVDTGYFVGFAKSREIEVEIEDAEHQSAGKDCYAAPAIVFYPLEEDLRADIHSSPSARALNVVRSIRAVPTAAWIEAQAELNALK